MGGIPKPYAEIRRKVLFEYLEKYKDISTRSISRMLFRDHPSVFNSEDHARSLIRIYRGVYGNYARSVIKETKFYKNEPMA